MNTTNSQSAIVIGAGIAGLCSAAHLAQSGLHVTVVEKNKRPGGRFDHFSRDGHHFDTGPTLLVMPLLYEAEFAALGYALREMVDLIRVDPTYHLVFDDNSGLELTSDMKRMAEQLERIEPGSFQGLLRYLEEGHRHYHLGLERLVNVDFRRAADFFTLRNLPLLAQLKPLAKHYDNMARYFDSPRLKAAFTFQDVYMGLSPFEALATFSLMPYSELAHGVWYPKGGMFKIVEALVEIARLSGVEFSYWHGRRADPGQRRPDARGAAAGWHAAAGGRRRRQRRPALCLPASPARRQDGAQHGSQALLLLDDQLLLGG